MAAAADRGTVRGAARFVRFDVAHAVCRRAVQLVAVALERDHGGDILRPVVLRLPRVDDNGGGFLKRREFAGALGVGLFGLRFPSLRRATDDRLVERGSWAMGQPV